MKRNLIGTLSVVALSLMLTAGAYGQTAAKANVPFGFKVGSAQLPAGTYMVTSENPLTITIRNAETRKAVLSLARREAPGMGSPRLVFDHIGSQYFLVQVWGAVGSSGLTLPISEQEKEMQIASGRSAAEEVIVALK